MVKAGDPVITRIAELVELALSDKIDLDSFLANVYSTGFVDIRGALPRFLHLATHFITDKDLRERDSEYSAELAREIREHMELQLRIGP